MVSRKSTLATQCDKDALHAFIHDFGGSLFHVINIQHPLPTQHFRLPTVGLHGMEPTEVRLNPGR